jgi:outer membrane protein TolC
MLLFLPLGMYAQEVQKYLERPLPDGWQEKDTLFQQVLPVDDQWWKVFEDATLDSLINLAMEQNPSVLMAINRIDQAKAQWRISQSDFYPSLSFDGGWTRQQTSGNLGTGSPQAWTGYYSASVQMSWQLDVFGVIRQKAKAQKELYAASREEYNATMVSLCAEVASAYFNLREMQGDGCLSEDDYLHDEMEYPQEAGYPCHHPILSDDAMNQTSDDQEQEKHS